MTYVSEEVSKAYTDSLNNHIDNVHEAGVRIGVLIGLLDIHDLSKWSSSEFPGYALNFHGGGAPDEFSRAWLHHIHYNPHHWQHWIFPDNHTPKDSNVENGMIEMPKKYVLEMVADWMGSEMSYNNSWDMTKWLTEHIPRIRVHSKTAKYLYDILENNGYGTVIGKVKFSK